MELTPQQRARVEELFGLWVDRTGTDRDAALVDEDPEVAAEVRRLIDSASSTIAPPPVNVDLTMGLPFREAMVDLAPGSRVGPYAILERLGEGGFGAVYKAEQRSPIKRVVALKIIKPGLDTKDVLARFESERQALARMDHPHIARVLDAGTTETGRPYFVMEHVPGLPLTQFADQHKLNIRDRLELFRQVCDAITHAHQKAIIHRDIKPSNVLAYHDGSQQPVAKVIDFGIAKALTTDKLTDRTFNTARGLAIGTYESMSPEQAEGDADVDTRTDVYSLGVLLYELLTGVKPFEFAKVADQEIRRVIREVDPPPPSTRLSKLGDTGTKLAERRQMRMDQLSKQLRSELEWIPLKAMRKERARRYDSPAQLREDVDNYLNDRPLIAGPESRAYVLKKWTSKHRGPLITAATVVVLITADTLAYISAVREGRRLAQDEQRKTGAALAEVTVQKTEAERQKTEAEKQRVEAERRQAESQAVIDFINSDVFAGATPERMPDKKVRDEIVAKMLEPAAKAVRVKFKDQPLFEAAVMDQIASSLLLLGRYAEAESLFKDALERRRHLWGNDDPGTLVSVSNYAAVLLGLGRSAEAESLFKDAMQRRRQLLGDDHRDTLLTINDYATVLRTLGRVSEAEPLVADVLSRSRRVLGDDHPDTIAAENNYALVLESLGRNADAAPLYEDALERRRRLMGDDHPLSMQSIHNLASSLLSLGRSAEAEPVYKEALERRRRVLGDDHPDTIVSISGYAYVLLSLGRTMEAEPFFKDALVRSRRVLGDDHPYTINWLNNYAFVLQSLDRPAEAEPLYKDARERRQRVLGEDHPDTIMSIRNYAGILHSLGRWEEARPLFKEVLERSRRVQGDDHPNTVASLSNYASALNSLGHFSEAEPLYKDALEQRRRVLDEDHPDTIGSINNYANMLRSLGRSSEAEPLARRAMQLAKQNQNLGPKHPNTRVYARTLTRILTALGKADEARAVAAEFGLADPTTRPATTQPTTQPLDDARVAEIQAFVAKLVAAWAEQDRGAATRTSTQPATNPGR